RGDVPRAGARGQCVVCGCVDSPRAACARRSARMRVSRTQLAISSTNPPARAGIQWTRKLIASSLLLGFKHDPQADEKQPAGDDEREWKPTGARSEERRVGKECRWRWWR